MKMLALFAAAVVVVAIPVIVAAAGAPGWVQSTVNFVFG